MRRIVTGAGLLPILICVGLAQTPSFEVASVKPAAPMQPGMMRIGMRGGPGTPDPGQLTYTNVALRNVIMNAYGVRTYQVTGPKSIDSERFDIVAKIPPGTSKEDFMLMLQNLLVERFGLKLHRETKDLPSYALVVGKNGPKMKESPAEDTPDKNGGGGPAPEGRVAAPLPPPPGAEGGRFRTTMGADGMPKLPPGVAGKGIMFMMMNGRFRMTANQQTMSGFSDMLANQLGTPVLDMTELKGKYDFTLDYAPEEGMGMRGPMGALPPPPPPPPNGGEGGEHAIAAPDGQGGPSIFTAVQEQLGLKLEKRKGPVELLVIDSVEKPTEN